jgi:hypothetical protein
MLKRILLVLFLTLSCSQFCRAMEVDLEPFPETLDGVAGYCTDLARRLFEQPFFTGEAIGWLPPKKIKY